MERNPEGDIEYQSLVDNDRGIQLILTENQLRSLALAIFCIESVTVFAIGLAFVGSFFYFDVPYVVGNFVGLLLSFIGLSLLGNGLFGRNHRGKSLTIYMWLCQIVPAFLYLISFMALCFRFDYFLEWAATSSYPRAMVVTPIFFTFVCFLYHAAGGWIINKYRNIQQEHDPAF